MTAGAVRTLGTALAVTAGAVFASPAARADDTGASVWHMDGANAGRTSCVDVEPARTEPVELWRRKPDEGCICEPVVWNGVVFVVSKVKSGAQILSAIDARSG